MSHGVFAALYDAGQPFALIDSRERRDYVNGHWFGSINIPLSDFARSRSNSFRNLIPDTDFAVHILDWQDAASSEAITQLSAMGYTQVTAHKTALPDSHDADNKESGFVKGEYVWSKAFGEIVAHSTALLEVTPAQYLADYQGAMLFDVRPTAEYREFTLPGSQSLPNSLLLANADALAATGQVALLHCAGRTRSIIGACTLRAAGYNGPYAVFRGGTQAWQIDGYEREHNASRVFATDTEASGVVEAFLRRWQIQYSHVDDAGLAPFMADRAGHLLFDVSDDAAADQPLMHGVVKISGTNLIQQTDRSIARYHVPITLFDHGSGSRAAFAAYWLSTMGFIVTVAYLDSPLGGRHENPAPLDNRFTSVAPDQIITWIAKPVTMLDFRPSKAFARSHLKGSYWANISQILQQSPPHDFDKNTPICIIVTNSAEANIIADILVRHNWQIAGIYLWQNTDFNEQYLEIGEPDLASDESSLFAGRHFGVLQDARDYLAWEEALPAQIDPSIRQLWQNCLAASPKLD